MNPLEFHAAMQPQHHFYDNGLDERNFRNSLNRLDAAIEALKGGILNARPGDDVPDVVPLLEQHETRPLGRAKAPMTVRKQTALITELTEAVLKAAKEYGLPDYATYKQKAFFHRDDWSVRDSFNAADFFVIGSKMSMRGIKYVVKTVDIEDDTTTRNVHFFEEI